MPNPNPEKTVYSKYLTREVGCVTCKMMIHLSHQKRHYATGCMGAPVVTGEDYKVRDYVVKKKINCRHNVIGGSWDMTYDDVRDKLKEAGIGIDQVGKAGYHLARYGDIGDYTVENCRFIHHTENLNERKTRPRLIRP